MLEPQTGVSAKRRLLFNYSIRLLAPGLNDLRYLLDTSECGKLLQRYLYTRKYAFTGNHNVTKYPLQLDNCTDTQHCSRYLTRLPAASTIS